MLCGLHLIRIFLVLIVIGNCEILCDEDEKSCSSPNVRTVIFRQTDMDKECWSREEIALLFTRRMMQELLPKRKPLAVHLLLDYYKECLETVKKLATSKRTHTLIVTALADTLGGYLQAFGLPMAHQAFYEGTLGYNGVKQLHDLQEAFKKLLRTDGGGWTKPTRIKKCTNIMPIKISKAPSGIDPCSTLVTKNELSTCNSGCEGEFLMPFLDDVNCPTAIALPFKDKNLYSIYSKDSVNILVKFYSRSIWCLTQTYGTASLPENGPSHSPQVQAFFACFQHWINSFVIPRLKDPTFYPAFGSVLRIVENLNTRIIRENKTKKDRMFCRSDSASNAECPEDEEETVSNVTSRRFYIIVISSLVIAFWIIVLIIYILCKWCAKKKREEDTCSTAFSTSDDSTTALESSECESTSSSELRSRKKKKNKKCKPSCVNP